VYFFEGDGVANLSGCIEFVEGKVAIGQASLPVHPSSLVIVFLQMFPFQSCIYHRRYKISAPYSIVNCDALIATRPRARNSRSRSEYQAKQEDALFSVAFSSVLRISQPPDKGVTGCFPIGQSGWL